MAHGTAQEVAAKWAQRASAAQGDYTAGVNRVTVSPGQKAAEHANVWLARLQDPATIAKFKRKVSAVTLEQWKQSAGTLGAQRFAQGVASKQDKFAAAMVPLLQYIDAQVAHVRSMPNVTFEDRLQRSRAMQIAMHNYQGQG